MFAAIVKLVFPDGRIQEKFFDSFFNAVQIEEREDKNTVTVGVWYPMGLQSLRHYCSAWGVQYHILSQNYSNY